MMKKVNEKRKYQVPSMYVIDISPDVIRTSATTTLDVQDQNDPNQFTDYGNLFK